MLELNQDCLEDDRPLTLRESMPEDEIFIADQKRA
jgi:hypothetical protein